MQALNPRSFKPPHERFGMGLERLEKVGWRQVGLGDVVSEPSTLKLSDPTQNPKPKHPEP